MHECDTVASGIEGTRTICTTGASLPMVTRKLALTASGAIVAVCLGAFAVSVWTWRPSTRVHLHVSALVSYPVSIVYGDAHGSREHMYVPELPWSLNLDLEVVPRELC
jgi:hypothetical protein